MALYNTVSCENGLSQQGYTRARSPHIYISYLGQSSHHSAESQVVASLSVSRVLPLILNSRCFPATHPQIVLVRTKRKLEYENLEDKTVLVMSKQKKGQPSQAANSFRNFKLTHQRLSITDVNFKKQALAVSS